MGEIEGRPIEIQKGTLLVHEYHSADAFIVQHFSALVQEEAYREFDRCLSLGVRVVEVAGPSLSVESVRREFEAATSRQKEMLEEARQAVLSDLVSALQPLFGADGILPSALRETRETVERELRKYCDEESTKSLSATVSRKVDEAVRASERRIQRDLVDALDLSDSSRGLGRVYKAIETEKDTVTSQLGLLLKDVGALAARRQERASSPRKGDDYEDAVLAEVSRIARLYGDFPEATGRLNGEAKRKRGDAVVTLDPSLTAGVEVRLTFEAMHRGSGSQKAVLQELDEAKSNRAASGGIAVLASRDAPASMGQILQRHSRGRFICVVEEESWETLALEVAYCWARVDALTSAEGTNLVDMNIAGAVVLVESASRHLADLERLRTKLGVGRNALKDAEGIVSELEAKLTSCLSGVAAILGKSRQG